MEASERVIDCNDFRGMAARSCPRVAGPHTAAYSALTLLQRQLGQLWFDVWPEGRFD